MVNCYNFAIELGYSTADCWTESECYQLLAALEYNRIAGKKHTSSINDNYMHLKSKKKVQSYLDRIQANYRKTAMQFCGEHPDSQRYADILAAGRLYSLARSLITACCRLSTSARIFGADGRYTAGT